MNLPIQYLLILVAWMLCSSCDNDRGSGTKLQFEIEFEKNYRAITLKEPAQKNYLNELTALKEINFDAYRTIAFTWQSAAMDTCEVDSQTQKLPLSSYQQLMESNRTQQTAMLHISKEMRDCIQEFYLRNWTHINAMIQLN